MSAYVVFLVMPDRNEADRYARALFGSHQFAFVFARDSKMAFDYAVTMRPDLAIVHLDGADGSALCRQLRTSPETAQVNLLLLTPPGELASARVSTANEVMVAPAVPASVANTALTMLTRPDRRLLTRPDRRTTFRGGRRLTDVTDVLR